MQYTLTRARRHTLTLQVNRTGELVVKAPLFYPKFLIDRFVESKERWISRRRTELSRTIPTPTPHFSTSTLKNYITQEVAKYSQIMSLTPKSLRFTQVTSYWGTCSPTGILSFNLVLRFTPPEAITYVVVHELAHLRYRNHGQHFWQLVNATFPLANEMRHLLQQHTHETRIHVTTD